MDECLKQEVVLVVYVRSPLPYALSFDSDNTFILSTSLLTRYRLGIGTDIVSLLQALRVRDQSLTLLAVESWSADR